MGVTKDQIKKMIKTVEGKGQDSIKLRQVSVRKNVYKADFTLAKAGEKTFVSKTYTKDALCAAYAQRIKV